MADWGSIAGPLIQAAAPTLGSLLGGLIPLPGGSVIGEEVGKIIAQQFGVPPDPSSVQRALQDTPPSDAITKLQAAEAEATAKWPALAQIAQAQAQAQAQVGTSQVQAVNQAIMAEVARGDGWWGKWRAIHAWELTGECPFFLATFMHAVWTGNTASINAITQLSGILMSYMAARFGVLGVHVWQGSSERQAAIASAAQAPQPPAGPVALLRSITKK